MAVRAQVDQTKQRKLNLLVLESTTNASIMYMLIQLLKEQLSLVVTQCLFYASTTSDHAQLRPEDTVIFQFCVALTMLHHGILVYTILFCVEELKPFCPLHG